VAPTVSCTVLAGTASWAEAFTKPAFVLGWPDAGAMYERHGLAVRAVTADGSVVTTSAWRRFELEVGRR
jgi:thiamine biosynthesis lipoprotein ApbE